jgi:hypothetical protein
MDCDIPDKVYKKQLSADSNAQLAKYDKVEKTTTNTQIE